MRWVSLYLQVTTRNFRYKFINFFTKALAKLSAGKVKLSWYFKYFGTLNGFVAPPFLNTGNREMIKRVTFCST